MRMHAQARSFISSCVKFLALRCAVFLAVVLAPLAAQAQSATGTASPSTFASEGAVITFSYVFNPYSYDIQSISAASQIKGIPITCGAPNGNNPITCAGTYTVESLDNMSGTFSDFVVFTGNRIGGTFNVTSPSVVVNT